MKTINSIETIKQNTFITYNTSAGLLDIMLGLALLLASFCFYTHTFAFFAFLGAFGPLLITYLKRKVVYPRIGVVLFSKLPSYHYKRVQIAAGYFALIFILVILASTSDTGHSLLLEFIVLALFIFGSIRQDAKYYLYGIMIYLPLYLNLFTYTILSLVISLVALITALFLMERVTRKGKLTDTKQIKSRYARAGHYFVLLLSILAGIYLVSSAYQTPLASGVNSFISMHLIFTLGNFVALVILFIGLMYFSLRFVIYSLLISLMVFLPYLIKVPKNGLMYMTLILGVLITGIGILILNRFMRNNPLLEVADESK